MEMIRVWIIPEEGDYDDETYEYRHMESNPPTYIFPKDLYISEVLKENINSINHTLCDYWFNTEHCNIQVKACQDLALRLEIEKEVESE